MTRRVSVVVCPRLQMNEPQRGFERVDHLRDMATGNASAGQCDGAQNHGHTDGLSHNWLQSLTMNFLEFYMLFPQSVT